jgi:hypothetical protein
MRTYPANSPQAAARIVAFTLLADGHLSETEYAALWRHRAAQSLGLSEPDIHVVVQHLAEDLLAFGASHWSGTGLLDESSFLGLLQEITDTDLRAVVLDICTAAAHSEAHHSEPQQGVLEIARRAWAQPRVSSPAMH